MSRRVPRWRGGLLATVVLATAGLLYGSPALFAAATVPLAFVAYESVAEVDEPGDALAVDRECSPRTPVPGEPVQVRLTVTNESERTLPDVRVVDGVPDGLRVADGRASAAGALRPGEELVASYELRPSRGAHEFGEPVVYLRSLSAGAVATESVPPTGDDGVDCRAHLEEVPVRRRTARIGGTVASDTGGAGFEFYATREYRSGDPLNRVDWRRLAKTGSLGTVEFREHRATQVVVIADGRGAARVRPREGLPDGATLSAYAAVHVASTVREATHDVGFAALGVRVDEPGVVAGPPAYVEPGSGVGTTERVLRICDRIAATDGAAGRVGGASDAREPDAGEPGDGDSTGEGAGAAGASRAAAGANDADATVAGAPEAAAAGTTQTVVDDPLDAPPDGSRGAVASRTGTTPAQAPEPPSTADQDSGETARRLLALLPPDAQVVCCSPVLDDGALGLLRELRAAGVPVTLCAPDVTHEETPGARLRAVQRRVALATLRREGVAVVDWDPDEPLRSALDARLAEVLR